MDLTVKGLVVNLELSMDKGEYLSEPKRYKTFCTCCKSGMSTRSTIFLTEQTQLFVKPYLVSPR